MSDFLGYLPNRNSALPGNSNVPLPLTGTPGNDPTSSNDDASRDQDPSGAWDGRVHANKYTAQSSQGATSATNDEVDAIMRAGTGGTLPASVVQQAQAAANTNPAVQSTVQGIGNTLQAASQGKVSPQQAAQSIWDMADKSPQDVNIWALLLLAMRGTVKDQNDQLQYDLSKLDMFSQMGKQMSVFAQILEETQQKMDTAMANEGDDKKKANLTVAMPQQYFYDDFNSLDANGNIRVSNLAKTADTNLPKPEELQAQGWRPSRFSPDDIRGRTGMYKAPDGKTYQGHGDNEAAQRQDVLEQIKKQHQDDADKNNQVSSGTLSSKVQIFTQQRDQLQKQIDKWQNRYQSDMETKNQATAAITSILKNMNDMVSMTTRNLNM